MRADFFIVTQGVINDFKLTGDMINLTGWGIPYFPGLGAVISHVGGNTFSNVDAEHQATLLGVAPVSPLANDFLFA